MTFSHPTRPSFNIKPEAYPQQLRELIDRHHQQLQALLAQLSWDWDQFMEPLESMHSELEIFWSPFAHLHAVVQTPEIRMHYETCLALLSAHETEWSQNEDLHRAICQIPTEHLSRTQQKIIHDQLRDFRLAGVHLPKKQKDRVKQIEERLSELQMRFENHLMDAELAYELIITDAAELRGLPKHTLEYAQQRAQQKSIEGHVLGIDPPTYQAVMMYAEHRPLRETLYQAYQTRASDVGPQAGQLDNGPIMLEIMMLRHELAQLLGFQNYAALSLETKMAHDVDRVDAFLQSLIQQVRPQAIQELHELKTFALEQFQLTELQPWDLGFISEKLKQQKFSYSEEALRPYFKASSVWANIRHILKQLYGIELIHEPEAETWHPDAQCFRLATAQQPTLGYLYIDLFARPNKRNGAWMDGLQTHRRSRAALHQCPVATLTCNFAPPSPGQEACYLHDDLVTLLHELGHCLHHLLTRVNEYSAAGIHGVEWDAVELPSQFFEHWAWDPAMLRQFTWDPQSQTSLPDSLIETLRSAQTFLTGLSLLRQLEMSWFDLKIHRMTPESASSEPVSWIHEALSTIRKTTSLLPVPDYHRFENGFSHIFAGGYAAGYYSYLWAEVLSSDCFSRFEEHGLFDSKTGQAFLDQILSTGSSRTAAENFQAFMGRPPKQDAFLRHRGILNPPSNPGHSAFEDATFED